MYVIGTLGCRRGLDGGWRFVKEGCVFGDWWEKVLVGGLEIVQGRLGGGWFPFGDGSSTFWGQ